MQQSLFTDPREKITATEALQREAEQREFARTHARKNQPTSTEAAERAAPTAETHTDAAVELVEMQPGATAEELARTAGRLVSGPFAVMDNNTARAVELRKRLPDGLKDGRLKQGPKRKCRFGRGNAVTWWPAEFTDGDIEREMSEWEPKK